MSNATATPFVVHLVITGCENLPKRHEVMCQPTATNAREATAQVVNWHRETFGDMTIKHIATVAGTLESYNR